MDTACDPALEDLRRRDLNASIVVARADRKSGASARIAESCMASSSIVHFCANSATSSSSNSESAPSLSALRRVLRACVQQRWESGPANEQSALLRVGSSASKQPSKRGAQVGYVCVCVLNASLWMATKSMPASTRESAGRSGTVRTQLFEVQLLQEPQERHPSLQLRQQ